MEKFKILATAHTAPDTRISNDDLAKLMATDDEWIYSRTGIHARRVVTHENTSDLATIVAKKLLDDSGIDPTTLDFIIVGTMSPDSLAPNTAAIVQGNIGATKAFAFDINAACSGFVYGLGVFSALLATRYQRGIFIGAEVLSKLIDWQDRRTAVLFGDGAAGVLVEATDEPIGLVAESLHSVGEDGQYLTAGTFANQNAFAGEISPSQMTFEMDGHAVYRFATKEVPKAIADVLEKAQMTAEDIDVYVLHQANGRIIQSIAKRFGQSLDKFPMNMSEYGNTSAASVGILLDELRQKGVVHEQQTIVIAGFGAGLTVGAAILKI